MITLLLSLFFLLNGLYPQTETVELKIIVTNINTLKGSIEVGIFNNSKTFLKKDEKNKSYFKKVTNDTIIFILPNLRKDSYAISLYHDINSDKKCNLNFIGKPIEPYGFSNNYKPRLFKPSFDDCKINAYKNMTIRI